MTCTGVAASLGEARAAWRRARALYRARHLGEAALKVEARLTRTSLSTDPD